MSRLSICLADECAYPSRDPRRVPYHTGKVAIGIAHIPKPQALTADQERMQAALLDRRTSVPQPVFQRLLGRFLAWL